jgi:hypothetical protein
MSLFAGIATGPEAGSAAVYAAHSGLFSFQPARRVISHPPTITAAIEKSRARGAFLRPTFRVGSAQNDIRGCTRKTRILERFLTASARRAHHGSAWSLGRLVPWFLGSLRPLVPWVPWFLGSLGPLAPFCVRPIRPTASARRSSRTSRGRRPRRARRLHAVRHPGARRARSAHRPRQAAPRRSRNSCP